MKRLMILFTLIAITALLAACSPAGQPAAQDPVTELVVSGGDNSKSYTRADLEALGASQADFNGVTYQGVTVGTLLKDAGFDPAQMKALKAVASDGYSVNYDPAQIMREDVLVAYATADGELTGDDGAFRMVLPGEEGKLNLRMLIELQVIE